jgi:hypothetical protein
MVGLASKLVTYVDTSSPSSQLVHTSILSTSSADNDEGYSNDMMVNSTWNDECHSLSRSSIIVIAWNDFIDNESSLNEATYQWAVMLVNQSSDTNTQTITYVQPWSFVSNTNSTITSSNNVTTSLAPVLSYSKMLPSSSSSSSSMVTWRMLVDLSHIQWFIDHTIDDIENLQLDNNKGMIIKASIRVMNNAGVWSDPSSSDGTTLIGSISSSSSSSATCFTRTIAVCN